MFQEPTEQDSRQRAGAEGWRAHVPQIEVPTRPAEELIQELRAQQTALEMQIVELRQTQLTLEESRNHYVNLYEFAPVGYFSLIREGMIAEVNHTGAMLLGLERKELLHRHFNHFIVTPEDRERWYRLLMNVLQRGERQSCELALQRGDDSMFHAQLDCWHVEVGGISSVRIALTDIAERKQAEDALNYMTRMLRKSQQLLDSIVEHIPVMVFVKSASDLRFELFNRAGEKLLGYSRSDLLGKGNYDFWSKDQGDWFTAADRKVLASEEVTEIPEEPIKIASGETRYLHSWKVALRDEGGEPEHLLGISIDITEQKAAESALAASEERFRLIMETIDEVFWMADVPTERMLYISPGYERIWGRTPQSLYENPCSFIEAIHPEDMERVLSNLEAEKTGQPFDHEYRIVRPDGMIRWVWDRGFPVSDKTGKVARYAGVAQDITVRKQAEDAAIAFESQEGMIVTDANGIILRINKAFTRITGYSAADAVGQTPALLKSGRQDKAFYQRMWATLKQKQFWHGEVWNKRKNGKIYAEWLTISAVTAPDGCVDHYIGTFSEITQNKEAEAEIHRLAYYDPLTQLPNRRLLYDRLRQALVSSKRHRRYGAILFLDLDNFKTLNDTLGHDVGDLLLTEAAQRLIGAVREGDTIARLGGDEFVLLLEDLSEDIQEAAIQVSLVGEKVLAAIASPYMLKGIEFTCTTSIGISLYYNQDESVDDLLKHADLAMYHAKKSGRNSLRFFDPAMQAALIERSALESDLRYALERQQLHLYYQIQVNSVSRVIGAETLLRWEHPERGLVVPDEFIPLAEETGLILPIGLWVLRTACAQIKAWSDNPVARDLQIAVNVSPRQFRQPDFVRQVQQVLSDSGINPARLKIELTESLALDNLGDTVTKMHALIAEGVSLAMDDFGTGYSSLTHLKQLPLDQLKIDKSFVRDLAIDPNDAAIVQAIITLGRTFGLNVIAEGVETEAQREFLDKSGCRAFQGYLFGRPMPVEEFEKLLMQYS